MSEGITCYERDETLCEDGMCLRVGCRLRNERLAMTDNAKELLALDVDALAQEIRRVDGSNSFGAGALAEALMPFIGSRLSARQQASVEWERLTSIIRPLIESVCSDGGSDAARLAKAISDALLAKYDIFEKVEG